MADRRRWIAVVALGAARAREGLLVKASLALGRIMLAAVNQAGILGQMAFKTTNLEMLSRQLAN